MNDGRDMDIMGNGVFFIDDGGGFLNEINFEIDGGLGIEGELN